MIKNLFNRTSFNVKPIVLLSLAVFSFINLLIVLLNHYYFRTVALDYAIYNFAFYDYAHFRISPCPAYIYPFPATFFQDHFSLTLIFLSPLYWLIGPITGTYSLLIIQWIFIVAGGWATYKLIELKSKNYKIALGSLIYYFVLYGRYATYTQDVNLAIIGASMVPVFLYYFETNRLLQTLICFIFLILNREDYSLWFFFISLCLILIHRKDASKRKLAFVLMFISIVFFICIFKFIFPAIEDEHKKFALFNFAVIGESPMKAFVFIITHPLQAVKSLFVNHSEESNYDGIKIEFYWLYLLSGGFVLLFRPLYLIPFIPLIAKKMYDDNPLRWSIETYYSIEFVSLMPVFVFLIISEINNTRARSFLVVFVCLLTTTLTVYRLFVPSPHSIVGETHKNNFLDPTFYKTEHDIKGLNKALALIPKDAAVCASCRLLLM